MGDTEKIKCQLLQGIAEIKRLYRDATILASKIASLELRLENIFSSEVPLCSQRQFFQMLCNPQASDGQVVEVVSSDADCLKLIHIEPGLDQMYISIKDTIYYFSKDSNCVPERPGILKIYVRSNEHIGNVLRDLNIDWQKNTDEEIRDIISPPQMCITKHKATEDIPIVFSQREFFLNFCRSQAALPRLCKVLKEDQLHLIQIKCKSRFYIRIGDKDYYFRQSQESSDCFEICTHRNQNIKEALNQLNIDWKKDSDSVIIEKLKIAPLPSLFENNYTSIEKKSSTLNVVGTEKTECLSNAEPMSEDRMYEGDDGEISDTESDSERDGLGTAENTEPLTHREFFRRVCSINEALEYKPTLKVLRNCPSEDKLLYVKMKDRLVVTGKRGSSGKIFHGFMFAMDKEHQTDYLIFVSKKNIKSVKSATIYSSIDWENDSTDDIRAKLCVWNSKIGKPSRVQLLGVLPNPFLMHPASDITIQLDNHSHPDKNC